MKKSVFHVKLFLEEKMFHVKQRQYYGILSRLPGIKKKKWAKL
jgi:hypothetical protein